MIDELQAVIAALNEVTVCGEYNMNKLLGSIQHLKKVLDILMQEKEREEDVQR